MTRFASSMLLSVVATTLTASLAPGVGYRTEYSCDFASQGFDHALLRPTRVGMQPSDQGLVADIPAGEDVSVVGFKSRFRIRGDFEVSVGYEVREWSLPREGRGVGPAVYLFTKPPRAAAELSRLLRVDGRHVYGTFTAVAANGERLKKARTFDAQTLRGRLRLRRHKHLLFFEASDDSPQSPFRVLRETEFSEEDVVVLRVAVKQSDPRASANVVITDLRILADELDPPERALRRQAIRTRWGVVRAILIATIVGLWLVRRGRRQPVRSE